MEPQNTNTQDPSQKYTPPQIPVERKSIDTITGSVVIVTLLILGGMYFFEESQLNNNGSNLSYIQDNEVATLPTTSSSDSIEDIDSDIIAIDLDTLEMQIDAYLAAAASSL